MPLSAEPPVRDLVVSAFLAHAEHGRGQLGPRQILDTLYLAKMDLPEGSRIRDTLPYYWYLDGPASDLVCAELERMVADGIVRRVPGAGHAVYCLAGSARPALGGDAGVLADLVAGHAGRFASADKMARGVYARHAPHAFYAAYKLGFMPPLERYCGEFLHCGGPADVSRDRVLDALADAILEIPAGKEFMRFNFAMSSYSRSLRVLLQSDEPYDDHVDADLESARALCGMLWTAFAYHACIQSHDPYYRDHVPGWTARLDRYMVRLEKEMGAFEKSMDRIPVLETLGEETLDVMRRYEAGEYSSAKSYRASDYLKI